MPGKTRRTAQLVYTKVGDIKDLKSNGNYNRTTIEDRQREPEAYKANIIRIIRQLLCPGRRGDTKSGFGAIDSRSDIRSGSKAATMLWRREPME
jgi:hypothetical protein